MGTFGSVADKTVVLEQLDRILNSPAFRNSRRYPSFLRHVVERTLEGRTGELKERSVGVEVFGRPADYDTNADPIVRVTAGEVRNRIARYYHEPGHARELRIELPPGSYVPEFRVPAADEPPPAPEPDATVAPAVTWARRSPRGFAVALLALAALTAALVLWRPWDGTRVFNRFWSPLVEGGSPVTVCLARAPNSDPAAGGPADIGWPDVSAAASAVAAIQRAGGRHRLRLGDDVTFDDLRRAPAVLVGAFNDIWTLRLTEDLRFEPQRDGSRRWILDRKDPASRAWSVDLPDGAAGRDRARRSDYAVVSRLLPARTGSPIVMLAGLTGFGTSIAGEFVATPEFLDRLAGVAPPGWERGNLQVVLETEVIDGHAGPPRIAAVHAW